MYRVSGRQGSSAANGGRESPEEAPADPLERVLHQVLGAGAHHVVELSDLVDGAVRQRPDAVRVGDDLVPQLAHDNALQPALAAARHALRPGGVLVAAVPEMDRLRRMRATAPPPKVSGRGEDREVTVQLWDWAPDGSSYELEILRLVRENDGWQLGDVVSTRHRVLTVAETGERLRRAGFHDVHRLSPGETGHPLPLWVAVTPS